MALLHKSRRCLLPYEDDQYILPLSILELEGELVPHGRHRQRPHRVDKPKADEKGPVARAVGKVKGRRREQGTSNAADALHQVSDAHEFALAVFGHLMEGVGQGGSGEERPGAATLEEQVVHPTTPSTTWYYCLIY